jgi:uncharacterized protein YjbJ (UPF0337 family)
MGTDDKMRNQGQIWKGRAKEATGKITDNERMEREGRADQAKGQAKSAMEKLKDAFGSLFGRSAGSGRRGSEHDDDRYRGSL